MEVTSDQPFSCNPNLSVLQNKQMPTSQDASTKMRPEMDVDFIENAKEPPGRELPPLLQDLSDNEIKQLEKKMLRKVDWRMLPLVILMYILVSREDTVRPSAKSAR